MSLKSTSCKQVGGTIPSGSRSEKAADILYSPLVPRKLEPLSENMC